MRIFPLKFYSTATLKPNYWWHLSFAKLPTLDTMLAIAERNAIVDNIATVHNLATHF